MLYQPDSIDRLSPCHRPSQKAAGYHAWHDLLFVHWRVPASAVEALLPAGLTVDTWDGDARIGLVPFYMTGVRPWWSPSVPGVSAFAETNVRTYVHFQGRDPGVWFFSLDAASTLGVRVARWRWGLNYYRAAMYRERRGPIVTYSSRRLWPTAPGPGLDAVVRVGDSIGEDEQAGALPGTLDHFLVERYILYSQRCGKLLQGRVHHAPYRLRDVTILRLEESLLAAAGLNAAGPPCHAVFCDGVVVDVFGLQPPVAVASATQPYHGPVGPLQEKQYSVGTSLR